MNSEELLAANGVDYAEAMERFGGNEELYRRIAVKFPDDPHYTELGAALEHNDVEAAYRHAHALNGGDVPAARALMIELSEAHASVVASLLRLRQG